MRADTAARLSTSLLLPALVVHVLDAAHRLANRCNVCGPCGARPVGAPTDTCDVLHVRAGSPEPYDAIRDDEDRVGAVA
jgi:hypothetical protein